MRIIIAIKFNGSVSPALFIHTMLWKLHLVSYYNALCSNIVIMLIQTVFCVLSNSKIKALTRQISFDMQRGLRTISLRSKQLLYHTNHWTFINSFHFWSAIEFLNKTLKNRIFIENSLSRFLMVGGWCNFLIEEHLIYKVVNMIVGLRNCISIQFFSIQLSWEVTKVRLIMTHLKLKKGKFWRS